MKKSEISKSTRGYVSKKNSSHFLKTIIITGRKFE